MRLYVILSFLLRRRRGVGGVHYFQNLIVCDKSAAQSRPKIKIGLKKKLHTNKGKSLF